MSIRDGKHQRLTLNVPTGMFNRLKRADLGKSIPALIIQLLKSHLTDLELREEFSKLNNMAID
ncbi:hypothetical protein SAMN03159475_4789 [Pseudomonas sp. NFPP33]|nr:hypothetical protein SAMN03159475_4789 [Pseudomonas sp. NFPP33]